jgi:Na+/proline symporter
VTPIIVAAAFAGVCVAVFLVGWRFFRMSEAPEGITLEQARRFGRLMMMAATALLLFLVAAIARGDLRLIAGAKVSQ